MQRPNPIYFDLPSTKCISQNSCEEINPFSFTSMQSSRKIVTNTRSRITHFLRMAASLGAKQYERSRRRFQGCLLHVYEYDWILYRPWLYIFYTRHLDAPSMLDFLYLSDDNNFMCIKAEETAFQMYRQVNRYDKSPSRHQMRLSTESTKSNAETRSRDGSSDQSVMPPGHEFQSYGF